MTIKLQWHPGQGKTAAETPKGSGGHRAEELSLSPAVHNHLHSQKCGWRWQHFRNCTGNAYRAEERPLPHTSVRSLLSSPGLWTRTRLTDRKIPRLWGYSKTRTCFKCPIHISPKSCSAIQQSHAIHLQGGSHLTLATSVTNLNPQANAYPAPDVALGNRTACNILSSDTF